ncbi:lysophospholipase Plb1 [Polychaeton citri CBS 116435]|uniref:Lysophospholipase n=1 Tax=Polychaeton citri CBS 116435 TaxID=1314669 RepID=A0A9P4UTJ4_9PEZI|nr:lysophospholipase Plb1 [Polychaeton citri CBS 116435]
MRDLLSRMNITGLDTDQYINNHQNNASALPNIGIACSGGGYRALMTCAGVVEAFDSRTTNSTAAGQLGGLLQATTYLAGLSGGNWMVGSLYSNNFTSVDNIITEDTSADKSGSVWQFGNSILEGPKTGSIQLLDSVGYYASLEDEVSDKEDAGFNTTITDYWGRALSYQLVNASQGGPDYTFSSIAEQDWFTSGSVPMPFLITDGRAPGELLVPSNTTVYEFNPFEFGTSDPTVYGYVPLKYIGTNFTAGSVTDTDRCVTGFDNVGFVMGTSSSLFNQFLLSVNNTDIPDALKKIFEAILDDLSTDNEDIADYPNPFYGWNNGSNLRAHTRRLTLVDGGEDGQNVPFHPLIQPDRQVDVIFAVDASADTNATLPTNESAQNWPDGYSLTQTYDRSLANIQNGTAFPSIPDINTFFNLGLNNRPTFFGCNSSNLTGPAPLVVYLPNAPYVYNANFSTFDLQYNDTERNAAILNAYNLATQGNATLDADWPACVGCAILSRSLDRTGTDVPDICNQCFDRYCWNGTLASGQPSSYVPEIKLTTIDVTSAAGSISAPVVAAFASALAVGMMLM